MTETTERTTAAELLRLLDEETRQEIQQRPRLDPQAWQVDDEQAEVNVEPPRGTLPHQKG